MNKKIIGVGIVLVVIGFTGYLVYQGIKNKEGNIISSNVEIYDNTITDIATVANDYSTSNKIVLIDGENVNITSGGDYSISGTSSNSQIIVDTTEKVNIELNNVNITTNLGPAIQVNNAKKITITVKEGTENALNSTGNSDINATIFANDTLVIEGLGELTVKSTYGHAIESDDDIIINSSSLNLTAKKDGLHANDNITINGGEVTVLSAYEGIECKNANIIINGGTTKVYASDDGLNALTDITINGGNIYVQSKSGDGIDSNGSINITGGLIVAVGGKQPEGGIDTNGIAPVITGGTIIATGGQVATPSTSSTQNSVRMGVSTNSGIVSLQSNGTTLFTFETDSSYTTMLYSSSELKNSTSYTLKSGGEVTGESFEGFYDNAEYSGGTNLITFTTAATKVTTQGGSGSPEEGMTNRR